MKLCLLLCLSFVPWSQGSFRRSPPTTPQPQPQSETQPQYAAGQGCEYMEHMALQGEGMLIPRGDRFHNFDWALTKELNDVEKGNIVVSPVSLKVVLGMLYEGARGKTAQEIGEALDIHHNNRRLSRQRFSTILKSLQTSKGEYEIKMGTHAFIDQTADVIPDYQCKLKTFYNSDIVKVDFSNPSAAVQVINNWAKNVTEGHIQDLISESETHSSTIMMLLNAVYFKGQWEVPFPTNQTKPGTFHLDNRQTVTVPLMNVTERFGYYDLPDIGAHMVELPYKGNKFSMFVLLPYNTTTLDAVTQKLGPKRSLSGVISHMMPTTINLVMPKFKFDFTTKLRSTLEKLGIKAMFSGGAELTDIAKTMSGGLMVSNVLQKAGISVTEAGSIAYAATAVDLADKFGGSDEVVDFIVDRPFLFFIEDTTVRTTVFVGKVTNPDNAKVPQETPVPEKPTGSVPEKPIGGSESDGLGDRISEDSSQTNKDQFTPSQPQPPPPTGPKEKTTQGKFNYFDGDLLQAVGRDVAGNFVISPASVKTLLGLVLEASADETLGEIKDLLRLPNDTAVARELMGSLQHVLQNMSTSQIEVDSETHSFLSKDFTYNTTYTKAVQDLYKAGVTNVDYKNPGSAANKINSWVSSRTRGLITSLIEPGAIDPETMTILVNTIYFNGKWKTEFQLKDTKEECFYSEPNLACTKVPMMYKKELMNYKFDHDHNSHIVQIPYKDERFSMVIVVPANVAGTRKIARDVNRLTFPALLDRAMPQQIHLRLPAFTAEYETDLAHTLTKMGLNTVFSSGAKIPFMINNQQARISKIIHKARIEVNEKGTKAAAASGATIVPLMSGDDETFVTADHPFYYFIYEKESRSVLFSGRVSSLGGNPMNEPNLVGGATPLASSSEYASNAQAQPSNQRGQPSYAQGQQTYAQAANRPANPPQTQNYRPGASAPTNPSGTPSFSEPQNEGHNIMVSRPSRPRPEADSDSIRYPNEQSQLYWNNRKRNYQTLPRSQRGSSS